MATWFVYDVCTDVAATRQFYGGLIGLRQIWDSEDDVAFLHDCVQVSFSRAQSVPTPQGWAFQPGWANGQLPEAPAAHVVPSVSIALGPEEFRSAVERLRAADVERLRDTAFWVGYWSFVVLDPDGRTVELSDPDSPGPE
ncbi:MAG TPA: hypothetical protein GXZ60_06655 [Intrasporangiaceae bacterium]|nr:hypothetical protein [Intrasporangiaceae bacterium]